MAPTVDPPLNGPLEKHFPVSSGTDHRNKYNATESETGPDNTTVYEEQAPQEVCIVLLTIYFIHMIH